MSEMKCSRKIAAMYGPYTVYTDGAVTEHDEPIEPITEREARLTGLVTRIARTLWAVMERLPEADDLRESVRRGEYL